MSTFLSSYNFGQSKQIPDEPALFSEIPDDCNFDELYDIDFNTMGTDSLQDLAYHLEKAIAKAIAFKEKCEGLLPRLEACINEKAVTASEQSPGDAIDKKAA